MSRTNGNTQDQFTAYLRACRASRIIGAPEQRDFLESGFSLCHDRKPRMELWVQSHYSCAYVLRGHGYYLTAGGRRLPLQPGTFYQRLPNEPHCVHMAAGSQFAECFVHTSAAIFQALVHLGVARPHQPVTQLEHNPDVPSRFQELVDGLETLPSYELPRVMVRLTGLFCDLHAMAERRQLPTTQDDQIAIACELLAEDEQGVRSLEWIAEQVGLSYPHFRRLFKQRTGVSAVTYRLMKRMERARVLLSTTTHSVQDVAAELGYSSPFTFSLQFKKIVGLAPREYRIASIEA